MVRARRRKVRLVLERIADRAVSIDGVMCNGKVVAAAIVDPRNAAVVQGIADAPQIEWRNVLGWIGRRTIRIKTLPMIDRRIKMPLLATRRHSVRQRIQIAKNRLGTRRGWI